MGIYPEEFNLQSFVELSAVFDSEFGSLDASILPIFVLSYLFGNSCPNKCVRWYLIVVWDTFPLWLRKLNIFLLTHCRMSVDLNVCQAFCQLVNWIICGGFFGNFPESSLCIWCISIVSSTWFENIFSHFVGPLFILLIFILLCRIFLVWCHTWFLLLFLMIQKIIAKNNVKELSPCVAFQ